MRKHLPYLLLTGLSLPFIGKPVHVDDANFVAMARQARSDPWRPLDFPINWQGTTEQAFDVLSNPPGIAWWLAPVADAPVWIMHLWMLPWLWLAIWGALRLGARVTGRRETAAILLLGSPVAVLATQALTPDLPLLACTLAGMSGVLTPILRPLPHEQFPVCGQVTRLGAWDGTLPEPIQDPYRAVRWRFAALVGIGALFRYSGAALIPLVALWPWLHGDRREALRLGLVAATPLLLLMGHDFLAHGQPHIVAMMGFQAVSNTGMGVLHKLGASTAMLGGAVVLPILCWTQPRRAIGGLLIGAGLGCTAVSAFGLSGMAAGWSLLWMAAGGAVIGGAVRNRDATDRFLLAWLVLGLLLLLSLRFSATRYWLPFFAPAVLLPLRTAHTRLVQAGCIVTGVLAMALAIDDHEFAHAQKSLAEQAHQALSQRPGWFAGHWGFQHHLEALGWTAIEDDTPLPRKSILVSSRAAWPQQSSGCLQVVAQMEAPDEWPGPRVHTSAGAANIHGFALANDPPEITFAPWGLGSDPLDTVEIRQPCRDKAPMR